MAIPGGRVQGMAKLNILKKEILFSVGIVFKFLREIKVSSLNNCNFFKVHYISGGGHSDCWPLASKYLAMPLPGHMVYTHISVWGWVQT